MLTLYEIIKKEVLHSKTSNVTEYFAKKHGCSINKIKTLKDVKRYVDKNYKKLSKDRFIANLIKNDQCIDLSDGIKLLLCFRTVKDFTKEGIYQCNIQQ